MTLNPRDYDLDELRRMARQRGEGVRAGEFDPEDVDIALEDEDVTAGASYRAGLSRELLPFLGATDLEKPYLSALPSSPAAEYVVFEWLEFLLMHAGYQGAVEALDYYASIGWLTEDVEDELATYLRGIDDDTATEGNALDVDDHLLTLVYVAKLQAMA